jgi:hypothetical protein
VLLRRRTFSEAYNRILGSILKNWGARYCMIREMPRLLCRVSTGRGLRKHQIVMENDHSFGCAADAAWYAALHMQAEGYSRPLDSQGVRRISVTPGRMQTFLCAQAQCTPEAIHRADFQTLLPWCNMHPSRFKLPPTKLSYVAPFP